jgi:hypothetical protein
MQNIVYLLLLLILTSSSAWADTHASATCENKTGELTVQAAIDAAAAGDTVTVPAGSCTWDTSLSITKGVILQGAGTSSTIITSNLTAANYTDYLITYQIAVPATDGMVDISGFKFDSNSKGGGILVLNLSSTAIYNLRIHGNIFTRSDYTHGSYEKHASIYSLGNVFGLVDNNYFIDNYKDIVVLGYDSESWADFPASGNMGTNKYLYVENNSSTVGATWAAGSNRDLFLGESGQGARFVSRYNTIDCTYCTNGTSIWDFHGDTLNRGVVAGEIYNELVTSSGNAVSQEYASFRQRGGVAIVFNNSQQYGTDADRTSYRIEEEYGTCTNGGGCPDGYAGTCTGGDVVNNSYYWGSTNQRNGQHIGFLSVDTFNCFSEQVEYWSDTQDNTHTASTYFTKDVAASRNLTTCTAQDVYWETDAKKLYRCTATNTWTQIYTPYTCPHPLTGLTGGCNAVTAGIAGYNTTVEDPPDTTAPAISAFTVPSSNVGYVVPVTLTCTDAIGVTGWCLVESDSYGGCSWAGVVSTSKTFTTQGAKTLYAFCRDGSGNVSTSSTDSVTVTSGRGATFTGGTGPVLRSGTGPTFTIGVGAGIQGL